ncbi:MAG TPA: hypothetical protein VFT16_03335 [Candidatus Saccharimonadales bacterium]|nr:hypothetical protein [Candidatus Saccharimonadales bacterium]
MERLTTMYTAVDPSDLRGVLHQGEIPPHFAELNPATLRAGVFLAAIAVAREYVPPRYPMDVMDEAMGTINMSLGVETPPL